MKRCIFFIVVITSGYSSFTEAEDLPASKAKICTLARQLGNQIKQTICIEVSDDPEKVAFDTKCLADDLKELTDQKFVADPNLTAKISPYLKYFHIIWSNKAVVLVSDSLNTPVFGTSARGEELFPSSTIVFYDVAAGDRPTRVEKPGVVIQANTFAEQMSCLPPGRKALPIEKRCLPFRFSYVNSGGKECALPNPQATFAFQLHQQLGDYYSILAESQKPSSLLWATFTDDNRYGTTYIFVTK
jgi:hypothetical protein